MAMTVEQQSPTKLRWNDVAEEDGGGDYLNFLLPPKQVIGPDENGIRKIIEYKLNDEGKTVKITTTTRVVKKRAAVEQRRSWPKFADEDAGDQRTVVSTEEIFLERPGSKQEENRVAGGSMEKGGAVLMVCRTCGKKGDHWTSRCPHKDLSEPTESFTDKPPFDTALAAAGIKGAYVPPSRRGDGTTERTDSVMRRKNDDNSVKVTNLSEDTTEQDLLELVRPFGNVNRTYVATNKRTGSSKGYGYVNFVNREDAERAICKLNGYGYDSLILRVEWAAPRAS